MRMGIGTTGIGLTAKKTGTVILPWNSKESTTSQMGRDTRESSRRTRRTGKVEAVESVGILYYPDGQRFEGDWVDDERDGRG